MKNSIPNNFWDSLERPIIALAPMVGLTDTAFRQIARKNGADVVYSEMIAADAVIRGIPKAMQMMDHDPAEYPFVVQLMGKDTKVLAEAAHIAEQNGASGIDLNFGCPANKIAKNMCGVMLMRNLDLSKRLIASVIEAVNIPVSIKVRVSINTDPHFQNETGKAKVTILDFVNHVKDLPIAAIMIHGRSFEDPFDGAIHTDPIREVKEIFNTGPVLANGGLYSIEASREILEDTGADGIGLARSVIGHPWVFTQVKEFLKTGKYTDPTWDAIKNDVIAHAELYENTRKTRPFKEIRRHLTHYIHGHKQASKIRQALVQSNSVGDVKESLKNY